MKVYATGSDPSIRVPFREVTLTTGERVRLYDTSGPYTDPEFTPDLKQGLPPLRRPWILGRVNRALSRTLFVNGFLERTAADGAIQRQPEGSAPFGSLVFRVPTHTQRAGQPDERLGLGIPAPGPLTEVLPRHHLLLGGFGLRRCTARRQEHDSDRPGNDGVEQAAREQAIRHGAHCSVKDLRA